MATWCEELTHWKRPWCWERLRAEGEDGIRGWDGWMLSLIQWTWTWANARRWWGTGRPGMLQSMELTGRLNNDSLSYKSLISLVRFIHRYFIFFDVILFFIFNWRIIALQYCVSFSWTTAWISHKYMCLSSLSLSPTTTPNPTQLGHHRAPGRISLSCNVTTRRLWAPSRMRTRALGCQLMALGDQTSLNTRSPWRINIQIPGLLFCRIWSSTCGTGAGSPCI